MQNKADICQVCCQFSLLSSIKEVVDQYKYKSQTPQSKSWDPHIGEHKPACLRTAHSVQLKTVNEDTVAEQTAGNACLLLGSVSQLRREESCHNRQPNFPGIARSWVRKSGPKRRMRFSLLDNENESNQQEQHDASQRV